MLTSHSGIFIFDDCIKCNRWIQWANSIKIIYLRRWYRLCGRWIQKNIMAGWGNCMGVEFSRRACCLFSTLFCVRCIWLSWALEDWSFLPTRFRLISTWTRFLEGRKCGRCSSGTRQNCLEWILFGTLLVVSSLQLWYCCKRSIRLWNWLRIRYWTEERLNFVSCAMNFTDLFYEANRHSFRTFWHIDWIYRV